MAADPIARFRRWYAAAERTGAPLPEAIALATADRRGRMTATIVESKALLETVIASVVAGVGVTFVFSIAIWGVARFVEWYREYYGR